MDPDLVAAFGGVDVSIFRKDSGPGKLMFRTDSRMICRIVFRKAFRNSAVLQNKKVYLNFLYTQLHCMFVYDYTYVAIFWLNICLWLNVQL